MNSSSFEHVSFTVESGVASVELQRPEVLNALLPEMGRELSAALEQAAGDNRVRSVLLSGAGRAFCAGADLRAPRQTRLDGSRDLSVSLRSVYNPLILQLRRLRLPVVCAVQGAAVGIGASIALACDLVIAAESAYFLLAFVRVGLIPDGGVVLLLSHRIGAARAFRLAVLAERLPATRAMEWGAIDEVVADEQLPEAGFALARRLAEGPTIAYKNIKRAANELRIPELAQQLELEATLQQQQANTHDYLEGTTAFLDRRVPKFTGAARAAPSTTESCTGPAQTMRIDGEAHVGTDDGEW
jgi:2-(1,2-epoxy-1,2-dihydrophenyl)acetyl-CoA isomerase